MDAVTYLKTRDKICESIGNCGNCLIPSSQSETCVGAERRDPEEAVAIVEKWLSEHPPVTYASKMRETFSKFDPCKVCLAKSLGKSCCIDIAANDIGCIECWNREYGSLEGDSK